MKSNIRALTAIGLLAAALTMVAPCARADVGTFTCTGDNNFGVCKEAIPTAPDVTFPGPTLDISWAAQTFDITLPGTWLASNSYSWLASNDEFIIFDNSVSTASSVFASINTDTPAGGLSEFGALAFSAGTGSTPPPTVPEPATLSLLGLGLAAVGFMRRRKAS
jgi:hypothetical protein